MRFFKKNSLILENQRVFSRELLEANPLRKGPYLMLYIKSSFANTIVSVTNLKGKVLVTKSCGSLGFIGKKRRKTKFAIKFTFQHILHRLKEYGVFKVFLCLSGFGRARFSILNSLKKNNIRVLGIRDYTPDSHNGCKPRKKRRG